MATQPPVNQGNSPSNLRLTNFLSSLDMGNQVAKACRFAVQIIPTSFVNNRLPNNDLMYMCDAAELPGRGFDVTEVRYYGPSQAFPNNTQYNTANFSFICRQKSKERYFFDQWMDVINPVSSFNFEYANNYFSEIKIYQFAEYSSKDQQQNPNKGPLPQNNSAPDIVYGWTLRKAYPILVQPQQVTWADQDILRLQVTFTYKYWDRLDFMNTQ